MGKRQLGNDACVAKISVVTVSFNSARTLAATLTSVARQTWPEVEHIVIDGGSTDSTLDVLKTHGSHVAHFVSEQDAGIYDAMNKGVRAASGDVIGFLNADDVYDNNDVLREVAIALEGSELDAVVGDVAFFSDDAPHRVIRRYRSSRFRPERLAWGWMPAHPAVFVRREVFERTGPFSTSYRIAGDYEWIVRAFTKGAVRYKFVPKILVRMRTGGVSTGGWRNTVLLNQEVLRACRENGVHTNWLKILSKYPAKLTEFIFR